MVHDEGTDLADGYRRQSGDSLCSLVSASGATETTFFASNLVFKLRTSSLFSQTSATISFATLIWPRGGPRTKPPSPTKVVCSQSISSRSRKERRAESFRNPHHQRAGIVARAVSEPTLNPLAFARPRLGSCEESSADVPRCCSSNPAGACSVRVTINDAALATSPRHRCSAT